MDIYFLLKSYLVLKCTLIYCFIVRMGSALKILDSEVHTLIYCLIVTMASALKTLDSEVHTLIYCLIVMMAPALHSSPDSHFPCE